MIENLPPCPAPRWERDWQSFEISYMDRRERRENICAWCLKDLNIPANLGDSHGICITHKEKLIADYLANHGQGK